MYWRNQGDLICPPLAFYPMVTIQLPIYTEANVVERHIDSICSLDWPTDKMHIQILDDSTDHTSAIVSRKIEHWRQRGRLIDHRQREDRSGFKAGALREALPEAKGEYIAIFDADFVPPISFLKETIPHLIEGKLGMVQSRWIHLNRNDNLLTRLSAILLDGHFMIEHTARNRSNRFFNFNGTAGVWRKSTIIDAGGWQHDTVTEDLDISYRAQLKGWDFLYLPSLCSPAEIPSDLSAFKIQQYRWAKGSIQTAKKLLFKILKAPIPIHTKIEAFFHLSANISHPLTLLLLILMPYTWFWRTEEGSMGFWLELMVFVASSLSIGFFYLLSQKESQPTRWTGEIRHIPLVLALGIGMSINQSKAFFAGLWGKDQTFVRTPKKGETNLTPYRAPGSIFSFLEIAMGLYCCVSTAYLLWVGAWQALPFLCLFAWGFSYVGIMSLSIPTSEGAKDFAD
ncbi:MAG: glycosyltransferase family 2 protein [Myxococcota bacterium]|nr:glycosyltransferase family 2 protein [Myxococcota bacterium]